MSGGVGADRPCACSHQARREGRPITSNVLQFRLADARADACMVARALGSEIEGGTMRRLRCCELLAVEGAEGAERRVELERGFARFADDDTDGVAADLDDVGL